MTAVDLNPRLFEQVRRIARWQRVTSDELTSRALSSYLDRLAWEKLSPRWMRFRRSFQPF